jgi:hypothetical protein
MAERYMVTTKNEKYEVKTLGVKFERGRAIVDEVTVDPKLGRDKDYVAGQLAQDFGYTVEAIAHSKMVTVPELPWKKEAEPSPTEEKPAKTAKSSGKKVKATDPEDR